MWMFSALRRSGSIARAPGCVAFPTRCVVRGVEVEGSRESIASADPRTESRRSSDRHTRGGCVASPVVRVVRQVHPNRAATCQAEDLRSFYIGHAQFQCACFGDQLDGRGSIRFAGGNAPRHPSTDPRVDFEVERTCRTRGGPHRRHDLMTQPRVEVSVWCSARTRAQYGLRGVLVGEAPHLGPASKRRRTQRLQALQRTWDSDMESSSNEFLKGPRQVDSDSAFSCSTRRHGSVGARFLRGTPQ